MTATINEHVDRPRTAAATAARRRAYAEKVAGETIRRLGDLPDAAVTALAIRVLEEFYSRRGAR